MRRRTRIGAGPGPAPVERIEVSEKNMRGRFALFLVFFALGVAALVFFAVAHFSPDPGWETVRAANATDLTLSYRFDKSDSKSRRAELADFYARAARRAEALFDVAAPGSEAGTAHFLNSRPNEDTLVDPALYSALERILAFDARYVFLAPIFERYKVLFTMTSDAVASECDPELDETTKSRIAEALERISRPGAIGLELKGSNRVRLRASDEYSEFVSSEGCPYFDFFFFRDAFVVDYIADRLIEKGYSRGILSSPGGFARNLGGATDECAIDIFDNPSGKPVLAGRLTYSGALSAVSFKDFSTSSRDLNRRYVYSDGARRTDHIDPESGMNKAALRFLCAYSRASGCADVAMAIHPAYVADEFDASMLAEPAESGIFAAYCSDCVLRASDKSISISAEDRGDLTYAVARGEG